jgi:iron(III) transport system substrate-binding protein
VRLRAATGLLLTLLAVAACGGSEDSSAQRGEQAFERVLAALKGLQGEQRERKLVALAKAEGGQLSVYTSLTAGTETVVADAFEDAYDIEASVYRATSELVAQRVSEESKAGFRGADVLETGGSEMAALAREGMFAPYRPQAAAGLVPGSSHDGWTATRFNRFVVAWNSERARPGERPRSLQDLGHPRWQGRIVLEESDSDWYRALREHLTGRGGMSEEQADRLLEAIAANARVVNSHSLQIQLLGAGEFAVSPTIYLHQARDSAEDGAPVDYRPVVQPVVARPQGVGILKTARHPATALLYTEWLLTDGQQVLKANNVDPSRADLAGRQPGEVAVDVDAYVEDAREWDQRYERLLSRSRRAERGG